MQQFFFIFLLFICGLTSINAQDSSTNNESGMRITQCDFEPDAPAVVIFDKGETKFIRSENGFNIQFKRHKRVKIFKESAFNEGEVEIALYIGNDDLETVQNIKAITYYYNGTSIETTNLDPKQIFKEPINEYWYQKKFALPNLKEGCIIEYSYTIVSPYLAHLPDWNFQSDIPTIYSEYKTCMIPFYTYQYRAQGFDNFDVFEKSEQRMDRQFMQFNFNDLEYTFGMKNTPSFKDESYISSKEDYIAKIDFQLSKIHYPSGYTKEYMTTWPNMAKEFMDSENFGKYIKKARKLGSKQFLHLTDSTDLQKIDAVISYMKKNYQHNGRINKWASKSFKGFTTQKTGNSANINLMALGILQSLNVNCKPVIISTRDHGKVNLSFPFSDLFNDVLIVAEINEKIILLDATDAYMPNNLIPSMCCNGKGFIIEEEKENWVEIKNYNPSRQTITLKYSLTPENNTIKGSIGIKSTGYISVNEKKKYHADKDDFCEKVKNNGLEIDGEIAIAKNTKKNNFEYNFTFNSPVDQIDNQIIFSPFIKFPMQENPLKQKKRDYDIDFIYPTIRTYIAQIEVPEGYSVETMPDNFARDTKNMTFNFKTMKDNNNIVITASYHIKKPVYPAKAYQELKMLFNNITEKLNQSIVINKNTTISQL